MASSELVDLPGEAADILMFKGPYYRKFHDGVRQSLINVKRDQLDEDARERLIRVLIEMIYNVDDHNGPSIPNEIEVRIGSEAEKGHYAEVQSFATPTDAKGVKSLVETLGRMSEEELEEFSFQHWSTKDRGLGYVDIFQHARRSEAGPMVDVKVELHGELASLTVRAFVK